jgi:hypothetical protein
MDYKNERKQRVDESRVDGRTDVKRRTEVRRNILDIKRDLIENLKEFLSNLLEILPDEEDLVIMRIFLIDQVPIDLLITQINKFVVPYKDKIKKRNESFFLNEDGIFGKIDGKKILHFKDIWKSDKLSSDNREIIFVWFDHFINIMDELNNS